MQHVGLIGHCLRLSLWQVWAETERSGPKLWWSGAVSGSQKNWSERSGAERERGVTEREWSGEWRSEKSGLMRSGKTFRSAHMLCLLLTCSLMSLITVSISGRPSGTDVFHRMKKSHFVKHLLGCSTLEYSQSSRYSYLLFYFYLICVIAILSK